MKRTLILLGSTVVAVGIVIYLTGVLGCSLPKTHIAQRKLYGGSTTQTTAVEDWPAWRGPRGDLISREPLPDRLPEGGPRQLWAADVGLGYSSPIAAGGRVYLFSMNGGKETLTAFDANSGQILWSAEGGEGWTSSYVGTRATPAIDGDRIYTYGGQGELICRNLADGKPRWTVKVLAETGSKPQQWGTASSPLIAGNLVYVQSGQGGAVAVAVDKQSGKLAWKSQATGAGGYAHPILADGKPRGTVKVLAETGSKPQQWGTASSPLIAGNLVYVQSGQGGAVAVAVDKLSGQLAWRSQATGAGGYAHPILADVAGAQQLIIFGGTTIYGLDPQSGRTLWQYPWQTSFEVNSCTPIYRDGKLFVTSEYDQGCIQLALSPTVATPLWQNKNILGKFQGAILDGDTLYANSAGTIVCVGWADGALKWKASDPKLRLGIGGAIVRSGDKLLAMTERGRLILARATPDKIESLGQADEVVEGKEVWSTPLIYGGRVYVKGAQELVCLDIGAGK
jgi:outer membrane protein assembly factor BamB